MNKVILIGRVGKVETNKVSSSQVTKLSVATKKSWKKDNEWQERTEWHNVAAWGLVSEYCRAAKGDLVSVEGELQTREFDQDGQKRYFTEVNASKVTVITRSGRIEQMASESNAADLSDSNDLPF